MKAGIDTAIKLAPVVPVPLTADMIIYGVAEIYSDPEKLSDAIDAMFVIYKEPIEKGLVGYAAQLGKKVDDLTDDLQSVSQNG